MRFIRRLLGLLVERGVIRFLYRRPLDTILATWGIGVMLQQIVRLMAGGELRYVQMPETDRERRVPGMPQASGVDAFLQTLVHARIDDIRALRSLVLDAVPEGAERIKWNAPSFCWNGDDRVTMRLHSGDRLELIFHRGAKPRDASGFSFDDPSGRIEWAAADRGIFRVGDPEEDREIITALVGAWIAATTD